jgi:hypothetical protein
VFDYFAGDVVGEGGAAGVYVADGVVEFGGFAGFEEVAVGAGFEGLEDGFVVLVDGEHDDVEVGELFFEFGDALDAGFAGEFDVHEDDVGGWREIFWRASSAVAAV